MVSYFMGISLKLFTYIECNIALLDEIDSLKPMDVIVKCSKLITQARNVYKRYRSSHDREPVRVDRSIRRKRDPSE